MTDKTFQNMEIPSPKLESWRYTDIRNIEINSFEGKQKIEFSKKQEEIIFTNIKEAKIPKIKENYEDKFSALSANYTDGIFIHIPKNKEVKLSSKITALSGTISSRTIIVLEENSSLEYVEEHYSKDDALRIDSVIILAGENSRIKFQNFQNWKHDVKSIAYWCAYLKKDSNVEWLFSQFGGELSRIKIDSYLDEPGTNARLKGVFFANKNQHFDFTTDLYHKDVNTSGDILVKGVVDGSAASVFRGKIKIDKKAQNTNSYLSDHSLVLSDNARSYSIPSLEIDANEVKASHGATLGKPNEEELFYLMARGLKRKEAERLIIQGFFSPVIETASFSDLIEAALQEKVR